jgi:hypothetical protein
MEELVFDFEAPQDVLKAILDRAKIEDIESSEPTPAVTTSSPLHSPLSGAEIKEVLEVAILVFKTGTAAAAFLIAIHKLMQEFGLRGRVRVTNRQTKKPLLIESNGPAPMLKVE